MLNPEAGTSAPRGTPGSPRRLAEKRTRGALTPTASGRRRAELTPRTAGPASTKRCYHREIWVDRPAARRERLRAERAASTDPLADFAGPLVYDGYLDAFRPADLFSGDPLDLEAIAVWEEENGVLWDRVGQRA